jgi:hypothetical protein
MLKQAIAKFPTGYCQRLIAFNGGGGESGFPGIDGLGAVGVDILPDSEQVPDHTAQFLNGCSVVVILTLISILRDFHRGDKGISAGVVYLWLPDLSRLPYICDGGASPKPRC